MRTTCVVAIAVVSLLAAGAASAKGPADKEEGGASAQGPLDKDSIRRVVKGHLAEVKACYEPELARNKALSGRVMVRFTVGADGKVTDSRLEGSSLGSAPVERCIVDAVRGWAFPPTKGGPTVVTYPFLLRPE